MHPDPDGRAWRQCDLNIYRFGPFTLDPGACRLTRDAIDVSLAPKAHDVLVYLVSRARRLVTKRSCSMRVGPACS
jgi:DNA-binding winged helix-turn-helix (wHTH) protein